MTPNLIPRADIPMHLRSDGRLEAGPKDKFESIDFRCMKSA